MAYTYVYVHMYMSRKTRPEECVFWNETEQQWSTSGLQTINDGNGLVCATTHLGPPLLDRVDVKELNLNNHNRDIQLKNVASGL